MTIIEAAETERACRAIEEAHGALRNLGKNPIKAAATLARGFLGDRTLTDRELVTIEPLRKLAFGQESTAMAAVFQSVLASDVRNGSGQYLTPAPVCDFIADHVARLDPEIGTIYDPFCGAGILLDRIGERLPRAKLLV